MAATAFDPGVALGPRLRQVREERGLSVRELARRIACSASLISQIERGLAAPSVGVLYALATELRVSTDYLFGVGPATVHGDATDPARRCHAWPDGPAHLSGGARRGQGGAGSARRSADGAARDGAPVAMPPGPPGHGVVQRVASRRAIDLASGVRWERLTPGPDEHVDFLEVVYEPSSHPTGGRRPLRHDGREYGLPPQPQAKPAHRVTGRAPSFRASAGQRSAASRWGRGTGRAATRPGRCGLCLAPVPR